MFSIAVLSTLLASTLAAAIPPQRVNYDGYRVVRIPTRPTGEDIVTIQGIVEDLGLGTWRLPTVPGANVDLMIPPDQIKAFEERTKGLKVDVLHEDLGADIEGEGSFGIYKAGSLDDTWFNSYHSYDDHLRWLNDLQAAHPENSEIVVEGASYEGRNITGIHIWGSGGKNSKPAAVIHGTVHAREWITTMVVEYIANALLANYASDKEVKAIVDKYDIYFFPVVNPDGFVFTQENDRMWRKNRQPNKGSQCVGVDLNRNWPYEWEGAGSSPNPCNEAFRGSAPGDAPETKVHTEFLQNLADGNGLKIYIDFHSYSQLFMTPYGFTCNNVPENNDTLQSLATAFANALAAVHGTRFTTGPICQTIYQANGNSVDWVTDVAGGETAFAAELRDTGRYGFILPPEQILPSGEETWAGFKALMSQLQ